MPPRAKSTLIATLKRLPPREFENLVYDLLFLSGAQNLRWRTPGADGGRDLECEIPVMDFSGEQVIQSWYVECKRYAKSIDWPTVYEKLTIAINHKADFLLFVTTSNVSSPCRDEIQRHNDSNPMQIRIWPFYRLEHLLSVHGQVAAKYGLRQEPRSLQMESGTIVLELTKLAQSTYAAAEFEQPTFSRIELLAAFTELLSARLSDITEFGSFVSRRFKTVRDSYEWCRPFPLKADDFDETSLRAALASIKSICNLETLQCSNSNRGIFIDVPTTAPLKSSVLFGLVTTFGLIECSYEEKRIFIKARDADDNEE